MADNIRNELKFSDHSWYWKCFLSTCRHSPHWRNTLRFTLWIFAVFYFSSSIQELLLSALFLKQPQKERITTANIGWACYSSTTSNSSALCFCFLSVKSPVVLSLFTKLWIAYLLGTLLSLNSRLNFLRRFHADPCFTQTSYRNTRCFKVYHLLPHCNWEWMANWGDNYRCASHAVKLRPLQFSTNCTCFFYILKIYSGCFL
jgi:hypothetical protein